MVELIRYDDPRSLANNTLSGQTRIAEPRVFTRVRVEGVGELSKGTWSM